MKRVAACFIVACISSPALAGVTQWSDNGHWYEAVLVGPTGVTWSDAQSAAVTRGGYLATVTSSDENAFAYNLVSGNNDFWYTDYKGNGIGPWLGGYQFDKAAEPTGHWRWTTNEPWGGYTNWAIIEPNNVGGEEDHLQFLGVQTLKNSTWNDYPNVGYPDRNELVRGYVVEFDSVPEPSSLGTIALALIALLRRHRTRR